MGDLGAIKVSNIAVRHSVAESITTTITPAANTHHEFNVYRETMPASLINIDISADRINNIDNIFRLDTNNEVMICDISGTYVTPAPPVYLNDESDMDFITPATVGTYIFQRIGKIWTE